MVNGPVSMSSKQTCKVISGRGQNTMFLFLFWPKSTARSVLFGCDATAEMSAEQETCVLSEFIYLAFLVQYTNPHKSNKFSGQTDQNQCILLRVIRIIF